MNEWCGERKHPKNVVDNNISESSCEWSDDDGIRKDMPEKQELEKCLIICIYTITIKGP